MMFALFEFVDKCYFFMIIYPQLERATTGGKLNYAQMSALNSKTFCHFLSLQLANKATNMATGNQPERKNSKFLLEESVICDNENCNLRLFGDCIKVVSNSGDDSV